MAILRNITNKLKRNLLSRIKRLVSRTGRSRSMPVEFNKLVSTIVPRLVRHIIPNRIIDRLAPRITKNIIKARSGSELTPETVLDALKQTVFVDTGNSRGMGDMLYAEARKYLEENLTAGGINEAVKSFLLFRLLEDIVDLFAYKREMYKTFSILAAKNSRTTRSNPKVFLKTFLLKYLNDSLPNKTAFEKRFLLPLVVSELVRDRKVEDAFRNLMLKINGQ